MRGTGIEKEVDICATNITNKTKCMSTHAKKCFCSIEGSHSDDYEYCYFFQEGDETPRIPL
jgi:hypothetical protein